MRATQLEPAPTSAGAGVGTTQPARPLRLAHVTLDLNVGGLESVIATLCARVDRRLFEPRVLCLRAGGMVADELRAAGIDVTVLPSQDGRTDHFRFLKVARYLRAERIDVLHTHNTPALLDGAPAALLAGTRTVVHSDHGRLFPDKRRYMAAEFLLSHTIYRMVGVSERTTANLRRYERIPARRLMTIPNGISDAPYAAAASRRDAVRAQLGVAPGTLVVGTVARLCIEKGLCYLIDAADVLRQRLPGVQIVIAGDGELEEELLAQASALGVDNVRFIGRRSDVPELMHAFDMFVLPSISEGMPMTVLEAMAAACPILATRVGGVPEVLEDGVSGLLVDPADVPALVDRMEQLLSDPGLRLRLGQAGRDVFRRRFSAEGMTRAYEATYLRGA